MEGGGGGVFLNLADPELCNSTVCVCVSKFELLFESVCGERKSSAFTVSLAMTGSRL